MPRKAFLIISLFLLGLAFSTSCRAERLNFATALRTQPLFALPAIAAQEKGFWKEQGLEVEWVAFEGGKVGPALAAGAIDMAVSTATSLVRETAAGIRVVAVADMGAIQPYFLWVRKESPIKEAKDLRGAKVGVTRLGDPGHTFGRVVGRALGFEKEIKFVGTGGVPQSLAALKAGAVDVVPWSTFVMARLELEGQVRKIVALSDYLPREWADLLLDSRRDFVETNPEAVKKGVRAVLAATDFVMKNPAWAIEKMKPLAGYPEPVGREIFKILRYSKDGRFNPKALQNVRDFLVEWGIVSKEKAPVVESLFTKRFVEGD